ncbi:hypothetical protein [Micromonospora deserti]|uniref:Uncharacterized protein n=1 Tax=Micromonospora deserti TaxID=2070366 RepID=A0A2W2CJ39_9ACTN|nr:hypothetical protein [Micromonospora deserti]PZF98522.1 hypothetical protein C1I99_13255 [Micromonospora deserti]
MNWDDEYDHSQPKEEPDCPPCGDSGYIGRRNCPNCNPTRLQHLWWRLTWRIRSRARLIADRLRGRQYDSEAPF